MSPGDRDSEDPSPDTLSSDKGQTDVSSGPRAHSGETSL